MFWFRLPQEPGVPLLTRALVRIAIVRRGWVALALSAVAASVALTATAALAHGRTVVCPGPYLPNGPEKGAPYGVTRKDHMSCRAARRAVRRGHWSHYRRGMPQTMNFRTPGFSCLVVKRYGDPAPGEVIHCGASHRSFTFQWGT